MKYRIREIGLKKVLGVFIATFFALIYILGIIKQSFSSKVLSREASISLNPFYIFGDAFKSGSAFLFIILAAIAIILFLVFYSMNHTKFGTGGTDLLNRFDYGQSDTYGSSKFMDEKEVEETFDWGSLSKLNGHILGKYQGRYVGVPFDRKYEQSMPNKNMIAVGVPGSGKTTCFITPNVYQAIDRGDSVITTDVKGDVYAQTFGYAIHKGYKVFVFNLDNCKTSDGWNILKDVGTDNGLASQMTQCILDNTLDHKKKAPEQFYEDGMFNLLEALILYVNTEAEIEKEKCDLAGLEYDDNPYDGYGTIGRLYNILLGMVYDQSKMKPKKDKMGNPMEPTAHEKIKSLFDGIKPIPGSTEIHPAYLAWQVFEETPEKNRDNFIASLATRLRILQETDARMLLGKNGIDLSLPGKEKTIIYVNKPEGDKTHSMMTASFFTMLFNRLIKVATSTPGRTLPVQVNMILDEFANIGKIPDFETKPATVRSLGIYLTISIQTLGQLKRMYPDDEWNNIKAMCAITMLLSAGDDSITTGEFSKSAGKTTVHTESTRTQRGTYRPIELIDTYADTSAEKDRDLLQADEIRRLPKTKSLVIPAHHKPIILDKFEYTEMPASKYCTEPVNINNNPDNIQNYKETVANNHARASKYVSAGEDEVGYYHKDEYYSDISDDYDDQDSINNLLNEDAYDDGCVVYLKDSDSEKSE